MRKIIFILINVSFSLLLEAQTDWKNTVQFFTPNAESLGKYGQVPVNYFNGLPQISIPITTFKVNGYELPISLSYYASGNKPDSHPGWVGLGWNLSAGGSINRIINGIKDETTNTETQYSTGVGFTKNTGYFYRMDSVNRVDWSNQNYLNYIGTLRNTSYFGSTLYPYDTEPDEFQVNIDNISASFYFINNNTIKIKSKSNDNFKVTVSVDTKSDYILFNGYKGDLNANCFTYINEIILTNSNGIKYYFGGDMSAIEFSFACNTQTFCGIANTWHIKKIVIPNGEIITFNYVKDGKPIVEQNNHYFNAYYIVGTNNGSIENSRNILYGNYSYTFIQPSYLTSVQSSISGKIMNFKIKKSKELNYNINSSIFNQKISYNNTIMHDFGIDFSDFSNENYYMQLDSIIDNNKKIAFSYTDSCNTRLKLQNITFNDNQNSFINQYLFEYNPTNLPVYNSKKTDNWGFYNNKYYDNVDYQNLYGFRVPDTTYMKAEILTKITYPTGGYSQFYYDPHDFSKVAKQFKFELKDSVSICGGLRIKKIITTDINNQTNVREFEYLNKNGLSSGILSGIPIYNTQGNQHVQYKFSQWFGICYYTASADYNYNYYLKNQQILNQLANTSGNHITYSRVTEKLSNGSKIINNYSNHEKYPDGNPASVLDNIDDKLPLNKFISKEIERGLLDSVEYYNNNVPVKKEIYSYNSSQSRYDDFIKSISIFSLNGMIRLSALKTYTFCPYLLSKKEIVYDDNRNLLTTETNYKYDKTFRVLTNQVVKDSHGDSLTTVYTYPFHIEGNYLASAPALSSTQGSRTISTTLYSNCRNMYSLNFLNSPVEITTYKNTKVIDSKLFNYGRHGDDFLPDSFYSLETTTPLTAFMRYCDPSVGPGPYIIDGRYEQYPSSSYLYDSKSNIIQIIGKDGISTCYIWGYNYQYPIAEIKNVSYTEVENAVKSIFSVSSIDALSALAIPNESKLQDGSLQHSLPNALVTTYTYMPFVGMTSMTDHREVTTFYEHDSFGRLKKVSNNRKQVLQNYDYHYYNQ